MDALRAASTLYDANPGTRDAFISHVLTHTLDWRHNLATGADAVAFNVAVPEHHQSVEISFALRAQDPDGTVQGTPLLLGIVLPPKTATTGRTPAGSGTWTAGPADRLAHALRMRKVPLGIVTNGDTWTLVTVSDGGAVSTATWTRHAWLEEPQTLRAFVALLTRTRFYGVPDDATLPGLLIKSLARQEEVTERLAEQSQAVVEMLVATLGRLDAQHQAEHGTRLLPPDVGPAEVYQAAVTVLMRLVFLLYAEERGLLPLDDDTYANAYAVNTLADSLRDRATDHGEDALERTSTGWYRLLALFRGVHRGARHEQLILPAYGGSLFDPDRFPWLEGRATPDAPLGSGDVPAVDDRTLLKALDSLQTLQFAKERRQVSYRSLDVEQIGYVYEGLLDQDALTATDWVVSIAVSDKDLRKNGPELLLADLEQRHALSDDALATWLVEQIKTMKGNRSKASILKALTPLDGDDKPRYERLVREASGNDDAITARVMPFATLLRLDPRDLPVMYPPGSLYLTDSTARANTGAVYTPRFLAEQVVETTLEAIVYSPGPLDTEDKSKWVLKTPEQILDLKVCDIAAGSGAFLVAATRYLAERLLESRRRDAARTPTVDAHPDADDSDGIAASSSLRALESHERELLDARRAGVDHCIYGVDINHMAVEMAKLSLWLITLDRNRPFSFLDDRLAVGDSLLGVTSPEQLRDLHFDPKKGRALHESTLDLFTSKTDQLMKAASELRQQIADIDLRDARDADYKQRLLDRSRSLIDQLRLLADGMSGASLAGGTEAAYLRLAILANADALATDAGRASLRKQVTAWLTGLDGCQSRPAHYPLLFPEVFTDGRCGFDAIIGNPPFLGGKKVTGALGVNYREHLVASVANNVRGHADLVAYMLLRADGLIGARGQLGLIATNTLSQGETREVGLDQLVAAGRDLRAAMSTATWPTSGASLQYCVVWLGRPTRAAAVRAVHDGQPVAAISAGLSGVESIQVHPHELASNRGLAFIGCYVLGDGFVLTPQEAAELIQADAMNREVLAPFVNGDDLNGHPTGAASRWVIDFNDWSAERAQTYPGPWARVERLVRPDRQRLKSDGTYALRKPLPQRYWQYADKRPALRRATSGLSRVIAITITSKAMAANFATSTQIFSHSIAVFASEDPALLAILSSSAQYLWVLKYGPTLGSAPRFTPSAVFETLPLPVATAALREAGESLYLARAALMTERQIGLTQTYKLVHDPGCEAQDIKNLRRLHSAVDVSLCAAYGWENLHLGHGHHETRQGVRWTLHPEAQTSLLDRLLDLNYARHAAELGAGLHDKKGAKKSLQQGKSGASGPMLFGTEA